ncbi:endonuclease/exonuclease/phosphatase family protein [Xanthomonas sp. GPE 39]|uniref:endonuclease/exonuclease/phosphatase family protein n=1 Tax=Xanthomonas sp. GPE 39 TaxID=1583099 RepID=UPI0005F28682|nr:endonuclease/exonuclease/phosphatase family protein [Xanthomonas sp. GPE 39]
MSRLVSPWHRAGWLLLAVAMHARALPSAAPAMPGAAGSALTIVTLNLAQERGAWPAHGERLVEALQRLHPDAIALQEVLQTPDMPNQAQWLAARLGYHCHFISPDPPSRPQRRGNALLTRLPVLEEAQTLLYPSEDYSVAGLVRVKLHGQAVNLYFTRLHATRNGSANRREQVDDLMAWIQATAEGIPSLLAGGFFATAHAPELTPLATRFDDGATCARDAVPRNSLSPRVLGSAAVADHVFFERGHFLPLRSARLFAGQPAIAHGTAPGGLLIALQPLDQMPESMQSLP